MKRITLWTVVGLAVVAITAAATRADFRRGHGWCGGRWHFGPMGYISHELKLSDAQVSQVKSIWGEERPTVTALLKDLLNGTHQMSDATVGGKFDEGKIEAIADAEGITFAKLIVEREHFKLRIYTTVLNEEQRQSADKLQQRLLGRLDSGLSRLEKQGK